MHAERRRCDRDVFGVTGGPARLSIEQRRFGRERCGSRAPLIVDVLTQLFVVLYRDPVAELRRTRNVRELMLDAESRSTVRGEDAAQHRLLRHIGIPGVPLHG
jgi:hypothetical protein